MNHPSIKRPAAPENKINTSNDWELCYLRHQYIRRVTYNPTEAELKPYMNIVEHLSKNTYFTYYNLFRTVGIEQEDVINIGRVHLVSFLGLYALDKMPEKKALFVEVFNIRNFREPTEKDFDNKNKANFTLFFKQRMEDLVRVCRQKSRNIKGKPSEEFLVFVGPEKPPKYLKKILGESEELGFKKIDFSVFKSIRKKASVNADATVFLFDNLWYVAIALEQSPLSLDDLTGSGSNPHDNDHNRSPEDLFLEKEFDTVQNLFHGKSDHKKKLVLKKFVANYRDKCEYKEEVATARKFLKELGASP